METDYIDINKALWNARVAHHMDSGFYGLEAFKRGGSSLNRIELDLLGDVQDKNILHLQCHFGQDTLSLARMGAHVTGIDFSERGIEEGRALAAELNIPALFICSDVYKAPEVISEPADIVFTSYGVLGWLPDMRRWAETVAACLKQGGALVLVEFHPVVWMYDGKFEEIAYSYFNRQPIIEMEQGTYADKDAGIALQSVGWNQPLADVLGSLQEAGFEVKAFREYDYSPYPCFSNMVETDPGKFAIKGLEGKLPMVYAVKAVKG